jgi:hypothetical protein
VNSRIMSDRNSPRMSPSRHDHSGYVVVFADPQTREIDAYGPLSWLDAQILMGRVSAECHLLGLEGLIVSVVPLTGPDVTAAEWTKPQP